LAVIGSAFIMNYSSILTNAIFIICIILLEIIAYLFSYFKFKKVIATHSILAEKFLNHIIEKGPSGEPGPLINQSHKKIRL